jgi:hypothetical protein
MSANKPDLGLKIMAKCLRLILILILVLICRRPFSDISEAGTCIKKAKV